jgi:hypothetical protein
MFAANRDDHVAAELTPVEINRSGNSAKSFLTGKVGVMSPASDFHGAEKVTRPAQSGAGVG